MQQLKDLAVGSLVKDLNTIYNGKPIIWKVVDRDHSGYPVTSTTLLSDRILSIKDYDNAEPSSPDSDRKTNGNDRWLYSNMRQWLNSESNTPWFTAQYDADTPPDSSADGNDYADENGFMVGFSDSFKNAILATTLQTMLSNADTYGTLENSIDKIFLLSMTEMNLAGSTGKEGIPIPYLVEPELRIAIPTQEAVDASVYKNASLSVNYTYYYWLRSCMPSFSYVNYRITSTGQFANAQSNDDTIGVRPALNLDSNANIAYQDSDGAWILAFSDITPVDLSTVTFELKETVGNSVVQNSDKFSGLIKLDWNSSDGTIAFTMELKKGNTVIPYERLQDLSDLGEYTVTITATDKAFPENQSISSPITFSIVPIQKDLATLGFNIINNIDSTIMSDGTVYVGSVQPTWSEITDITISVLLTKDTVPDNSFVKNKLLSDIGSYSLTYLLTDNYYPDNQLTGTINFTITPAPVNWSNLGLNLKDELTGRSITSGSKFILIAKPTWTELPNVTYNYTMMFASALISYTKGDNLSSIGLYQITFNLVDKNYLDNTFSVSISFEITEQITDFNTYSPEFIDYNQPNPDVVISEGMVFKDETITPTWRTLPTDVTVASYSLSKDGVIVPFTNGTDSFVDVGKYHITLLLQNGAIAEKQYIRNFEIRDLQLDLTNLIKVITDFDNSEIYEGRKFQQENVLPDWKIPQGVSITYSLKENDIDMSFVKGITVLSDIGSYEIDLVVVESAIPTNTLTIARHFQIIEKSVNMTDINMTIINILTGAPINNGDIYKGISVKPFWYSSDYPSSLSFESWITYNGVRRTYDKTDDTDVLTENGDYILEVKATDKNFSDNYKMTTRTFKIIPISIDLSGKDTIIKDKITNTVIEEGQIYRGDLAAVQPTWNNYPELIYSYSLYFNNTLKIFTEEDILRDKGYYRLIVTASDPNYPESTLQETRTFSIQNDIDPTSGEEGEAYLNGLPYVMGTPITKSGDYNLLVINRKTTNFKVTMSEVNFKVIGLDEEQKPLILVDPEVIPAISDNITIRYPAYGTANEYKINSGEWHGYTVPFDIMDNCTIIARYTDPDGYFVETNKDIINIDNLPPDPPVVLGFKPGVTTYYAVLPTVEFVYGVDYTATLNGELYALGTPIANEGAKIQEYTLVVVAKKRLNGLTASTVVNFTLDSTPPDPPVIAGVLPNVIQANARPDVLIPDYTNLDYESYLNGRIFTLGTYIDDPDSYNMSVTATKKVNGLRATSIVVFSIVLNIPDPISPLRISLEPLTEANKDIAIDGELIIETDSGHISIYDDGYLISKTREIEEGLDLLDKRIITIQTTLQNNETRIDSLEAMRENLRKSVDSLKAKNYSVTSDKSQMSSIMSYLDFVDEARLIEFDSQLIDIDTATQNIKARTDSLKSKLNGKNDLALQIMAGLQTNSSFIGEVTWLKNNPNYPRT